MKNFYLSEINKNRILFLFIGLIGFIGNIQAQRATVAIPVADGTSCSAVKDSVKYFNYDATTKVLTHRSNCKPSLAAPGFTSNLSTITFNPYDGYLYFTQIALVLGVYNSYTYRWLPTTCPGPNMPVYKTFLNQFVAGVEFDQTNGLGYQINFVDTTGYPPINPDATGIVGQFTSGAVVNGNPAMAYYDATNKDLKYVRANDASGQTWGTPITISSTGDVGQYASLTIINGNPAISYYDLTNGDLKYVQATNANGTAWGTPVTVEATGNVGQFTSLTVVNGNPAISYYDVTNLDLRYIRATDVNGTTWGTPVAVSTTGSVGQYTSMAVVNGNPAISYYDATNGDLKYVRSTDASGTTWGTPVTPEATNNIGQFSSLTVVNGNPAISYYDVTNLDLRYVRASDASGTAWGTPVAVTTAGSVGQYTSMIMVNGNPAISYYDATGKDLKYVRASNANGTAWNTPVIAEATGDVGQYSSLIIANGDPAVCYYDVTNLDVKYVRAYDVNGAIWYKNSAIYKMELQQVNFVTGGLGISKPINFGARYIYLQNGDVVMTPGGQMLAAYNNKYFTVNWKDYNTAIPLVATFIDTLRLGANNSLVGLSYSDGKLVGGIQNTTVCSSSYKEIDILTGAQSPITYSAGAVLFAASDMTDITSGIGSAKKLISATENPLGSNTYDVVYEVYIKNYGGTPVTNVQAYDTLTKINGLPNVISGSITSFTAPVGITQNAAYDGKTAGKFNLLTPGGTLSNIPGQNAITLRISCKISNILPGIVYNNQAVVSAVGMFGDNLRDSSTNGSLPDLNSNDKPDDVGESQPTPLLISITPQIPPCSALTNVLYTQNFGSGAGLSTVIPAPVLGSGAILGTGTSLYTGSIIQPISTESYTLTDTAKKANNTDFIPLRDHTGNANGRMLIVNADAANTVMYRATFTASLCANQEYSLSFYAAFIGNTNYRTVCDAFGGFKYPKIKMRVIDGVSNLIISQVSTPDITDTTWQQFGFKFVTPSSFSSIIIELTNDALGGCGNDIAIDDFTFGNCDALPVVNINGAAGCMGSSTTFTCSLSDPTALPGIKDYQWQIANALAGPYSNIVGATLSTYTIASISSADTGKYYRVIVAAQGNIGFAGCRYLSPGIILTGKISSVSAASATKSKNNICPGISVNLGITGGTLGTNAVWKWYAVGCGTTLLGTGTSLTVTPSVTTTYYVRAEGDCNTTACQQVTVFISCDIDKDKDGIPDFVESNMASAFLDVPVNGIINAYDPLTPGFVDYNNDFVNDNYQADGDINNNSIPNYLDPTFPGRVDVNLDGIDDQFDIDLDGIINILDLDSDNDGIPDVVEAYGVDTDGNGKIDNFTDTDGDGLSDNVDTRINLVDGAYNTGLGLGLSNLDGDAVPNFLDLDSDNDGIPDVVEVGAPDVNNNGKVDGFVDANSDGLHDGYINATALLKTGSDINGDGRADSFPNKNLDRDFRPNAYDMDSDGDGIVDVIEGGLPDVDLNGIVDGVIGANGWSTTVSALPALNLRNTDAIGNSDYLDIDSDEDGIPDNIEGQSTAGYLLPTLVDADGDGLMNPYDNLPAAFGGAGIFVYDHDVDGTPDYRDLDTDADGKLDRVEGNDFNLNGLADDNVTLTGLDTDGDGLDNRFDSLNSVINIKGTSYMMGNGGIFTGDAAPGSRTTVQRTIITQTDRDWRYSSNVLPVQFISFSGSKNKNNVLLSWTIIVDKEVDRFEIERSTDNRNFSTVITNRQAVALQIQQSFSVTDDITNVNSDIIYYRLKVIGKAGDIKYSNVLVFRVTQTQSKLKITPNPAKDHVFVSFYSDQESEVVLRLINNSGKIMEVKTVKVAKGNNLIPLNGLTKYSSGVYALQLFTNEEILTEKLILVK